MKNTLEHEVWTAFIPEMMAITEYATQSRPNCVGWALPLYISNPADGDFPPSGQDAHGGNVQFGCGARFFWDNATPYVGDRGARKTTVRG